VGYIQIKKVLTNMGYIATRGIIWRKKYSVPDRHEPNTLTVRMGRRGNIVVSNSLVYIAQIQKLRMDGVPGL
jgi:hypothetical protein